MLIAREQSARACYDVRHNISSGVFAGVKVLSPLWLNPHFRPVFSRYSAICLISNREDAYDLLQDTTLKALDNEDKYVENTNFKGWVFTIMRNLFINNYRAAVRASVVVDRTDDLFHLNLSQESGLQSPEGSVTAQEINRAMAQIGEEFRQCFVMYIQGYKYQEIAEIYSLPLGTVKSRIFVARRRLQGLLADLRYD